MFVVPTGGVLFLAGWTALAIAACPRVTNQKIEDRE
jgi:uncharacterized membrane protein YgdD (TMEM256/DUF423 family)